MNTLTFHPMDKATVSALRAGGPDAYARPAEIAVSDGGGVPCRACLGNIPVGHAMLIVAHRPFQTLHPYAETGPIFLCANACAPPRDTSRLPDILQSSPTYLVKGYTQDERIKYGTGKIVASGDIQTYAASLLAKGDIAFVDVRSASNNCYMTRITRKRRACDGTPL